MADPPDDITFNAIVMAESLSGVDRKTGELLRDYINSIEHAPARATLITVESRAAFLGLLHDLESQAREYGLLPVLHVEAHGNAGSGIWFADDSCLSWEDFCDRITPLNEATGMRLLVTVAACYGSSLISGVRLSKPAPCFALVGATEAIDEPEVIGAFRDFYGAMLRTLAAGPAVAALKRHSLRRGGLDVITARLWFELLMTKYLREELTPRKLKESALRLYHKARTEPGQIRNVGDYKRLIRRELPGIVRRYFETFFMISDPTTHPRYRSMWARLEAHIEVFRRSRP